MKSLPRQILLTVLALILTPCCLVAEEPAHDAVKPVPRQGGWMTRHESFNKRVAAGKVDLVFIGDSITQGMDARGPASAYAVQLARVLDVELLNQGVGGHIFDLDALDDELPYHPDIITIAYGTNDWSRDTTREEISSRVERYLTRL